MQEAPRCASTPCLPVPSGGGPRCGLYKAETVDYGQPCGFHADCATRICAPQDRFPGCASGGCCTQFCDLTAPDPAATCPGVGVGQQCLSIWEPGAELPGLEHVGACLLP
jgi:hypothetical protein